MWSSARIVCRKEILPMNHKKQKMALNVGVFAAIMAFTCWSVFKNQNMAEIADSVRMMSVSSLAAAMILAVFYVAGEGGMICYLLKGIGEKAKLPRCIAYSFIGFFFSGITPSATGGQPMQLYYMKKDGHSVSASSVVLMTVAVVYKFVLVLTGMGILLFWRGPLKEYLKQYYLLYFVGLFLNAALVIILLLIMLSPGIIMTAFSGIEKQLIYFGLWKDSEIRQEKVKQFLAGYRETVCFLQKHKKRIGIIVICTFLQRFCVFVLTYAVYCGLGLHGAAMTDVVLLQASVYIAVDMLPIPGAQGITEAMYKTVFENIFPRQYLIASMCISRGISFYFIMAVSFAVWGIVHWKHNL